MVDGNTAPMFVFIRTGWLEAYGRALSTTYRYRSVWFAWELSARVLEKGMGVCQERKTSCPEAAARSGHSAIGAEYGLILHAPYDTIAAQKDTFAGLLALATGLVTTPDGLH